MSLKRSPRGVQKAYQFHIKYLKNRKSKIIRQLLNNRVIKAIMKLKTILK